MKINKKGISVLLSGMLLSGMLVGCSDNKDKTMDKADTKIEEQKFNEEVVADNEYFKMTVLDKDMDEYNSFVRIKVLVENKTDKDIIVYLENICVDGVMNDPAWCVEVTANNKAYPYIEWLIDSETNPNVKTVEDLKNIEGEVYVTDSNYNELFRTDINMLMTKDNVKTEAKATEEKEVEVTKDKEEEKSSSQDNKNKDNKKVETTKPSVNDNKVSCVICGKKGNKENMWLTEDGYKCNKCVHKCPYCLEQMTEFKHGQYICNNSDCFSNYDYDDTDDSNEEEPVYDEYGYDQNGNYDPNEDLNNDREWDDEDYERWNAIHGDEYEEEADDVE